MDDSIDGVLEVDRCTIVAESLVTNSEQEVMAIRVMRIWAILIGARRNLNSQSPLKASVGTASHNQESNGRLVSRGL